MPTESNNPTTPSRATAAQRPVAPGHAANSALEGKSNALRQTIIPLFITLAVLTPALGVWFLWLDADSPFRLLPAWTPAALFAAGGVSGCLAALNMAAAVRRSRRR